MGGRNQDAAIKKPWDVQTDLKVKQCFKWIIEHYLMPNDAFRQKNQHPSSNEAKNAVKIIAS